MSGPAWRPSLTAGDEILPEFCSNSARIPFKFGPNCAQSSGDAPTQLGDAPDGPKSIRFAKHDSLALRMKKWSLFGA